MSGTSAAALIAVTIAGFFCALLEGRAGAAQRSSSAADADQVKPRGETKSGRTNRLARETSPYLLMHAHNPVDWHPWSPLVFEKAKREGKPIFLSIGYSSCHWCHVMERLVFENEAIARTMNDNFINVKVDREERPDVDDVYMTAFLVYSQAIGSGEGGGWPLSMFLTPEGKPFAGGTFFPEKDTDGRSGFPTVLSRVLDLWRNKRASVDKNGDMLAAEVRRVMRPGLNLTPVKLDRGLAGTATKALIESSDPEFGGVEFDRQTPNAPKFPAPPKLELLEHEAQRAGNKQAAAVLAIALDHMAAGGIRDHLGGGFHRYSTDRRWHVPHFEKMLYDQAQLAELYAEAYRRTGSGLYRAIAEETLNFVLSEMLDPAGGFISALDAETDGVEGTYYVWSIAEVDAVLGPRDARLFKRAYGFDDPPAFERGYVVHQTASPAALAEELRISADELQVRLKNLRSRMLARRRERAPVMRDDKIITAWNGLAIRALARAGAIFKRDRYVLSAEKTATFLLKRMRGEHGELLRTFRSGQAKIPAYLEDYAYFIDGLLALHATTRDEKWLRAARGLCDEQIRLFWDDESKGFYFTSQKHEALIARTRNAFDAVLPSPNSVSVRNLDRLASYCREKRYRDLARQTLEAFAPALAKAPRSLAYLAIALDEYLDDSQPAPGQSLAEPAAVVEDGAIIQAGAETAGAKEGSKNRESVLAAKAFVSVDKLPPGGTCEIAVILAIKPGWHINTNSVEEEWQVPTELTLESKLGATLDRVSYPKGKRAAFPGAQRPVLIYEKQAVIRGVIAVPEDAAGKVEDLKVVVKYQACNERGACLAPARAKLVAKVQVAPDRDSVREINPKLFPKTNR